MFEKLRLFRLAHTGTADEAIRAAREQTSRFREHPLYYLEVLSAAAWLCKRRDGTIDQDIATDLRLFDELGATGLRQLLTAQGFLD